MIQSLARKWDFELQKSVFVGDRVSDMQAGHRAGLKHLYFLSPEKKGMDKSSDILTINLTSVSNLFDLVDDLSTL